MNFGELRFNALRANKLNYKGLLLDIQSDKTKVLTPFCSKNLNKYSKNPIRDFAMGPGFLKSP